MFAFYSIRLFYLIFLLEVCGGFFKTNLPNRIRKLEERRSNVDKSTQTTQAEATETKEDSGKEEKVSTQK